MVAFSHISHLPHVIGAVDGAHIRIKAPKLHPDSYNNRKKFHSIVLQAVCNTRLLFTDVHAGWPGSSHDARVWRNSPIYRAQNQLFPPNSHLVGDSAYPLSAHLITPFRDYGNLSIEQRIFNTEVSRARQTIERAFGHLKGRFRKLRDFFADDIELIVDGTISACVMHNICILNDEELLEEYEDEEVNNDLAMPYNNDQAGVQRRQELMQQLNQ
ncbi:putative nuclease HARBI1 [Ptychodera flava]|uniref:putative nuclease HARBI1 n=1 Tax=Ptychodera flava TaxID=63121 RepID=UPI003969F327